MAIRMPTRGDVPHYTFEIDLELRTYRFEFRWNERAQAWFMGISDLAEVPLLDGRKLALDVPLLARFRDPRLPPGELLLVDTSDEGREPGLADLGERVRLLYFTRAELLEAQAGGL